MLQSKQAKKALQKVQRVAKEVQRTMRLDQPLAQQLNSLRDVLDRHLERDEYFVIVDEDGKGVVHTNRLREGMVFDDEVGKKRQRQLLHCCNCINEIQVKCSSMPHVHCSNKMESALICAWDV
ncbi:hypothetical protein LR68_03990 [Anoxybacillus sp. BCO1]|nr:hypothetical protein LR68_03990 [Anoxybacillus sp. BCO1]